MSELRVLGIESLVEIHSRRIDSALAEIRSLMALHGELDYDEYCRERWGIFSRRETGRVGNRGGVYFVRPSKRPVVKVGVARDLESRLSALQTGSPERLVVLGIIKGAGFDRERLIHERFARKRINGEWFELDDEMLRFIASESTCPKFSAEYFVRWLVSFRDSVLRIYDDTDALRGFERAINEAIKAVKELADNT